MLTGKSVKVVKATLSHPGGIHVVHRPLLCIVVLPLLNLHKRDNLILSRIEGLAYKIQRVVALPREGTVPMPFRLRGVILMKLRYQRHQLKPCDYLCVRQTRVVWVGEVRGVQVEIRSHAEGLQLVALDFQVG